MGGIKNRLHFFQPDAGIFNITANAITVGLERIDGVLGPCGFEGRVVFEKIVVAVYMCDRENLKKQCIVTHQICKKPDSSL